LGLVDQILPTGISPIGHLPFHHIFHFVHSLFFKDWFVIPFIMEKIILIYIIISSVCSLSAQKIDTLLQAVPLQETVISANRSSQSRTAVAQQVSILTRPQIELLNPQNTGDLLRNSGAVFVQQSQMGGGSPVIRGFEASRVLLVVDGVRMNNAIYRSGHLQNVITVDANMLERTEILFGPASTVYGSDGLGGAVCFFTKDPTLATVEDFKTTGNAFFRYGSVNNEKTVHADISLGSKKVGSITSFTFSDFGDLRMGTRRDSLFGLREFYVQRLNGRDSLVRNDDPYLQRFSGYRQYDVLQKFVWKPNENVRHTLNFQYSTSSDIPRYDRLTDPGTGNKGLRFAEWYYGPQDRLMATYGLQIGSTGWFSGGIHTTVSYQGIEESRVTRRFGNNNLDARVEQVGVFALTAEGIRTNNLQTLRVGIDIQHNVVDSRASRTNIATGVVSGLSTRYPDGGSNMTNMGVYTSHGWSPRSGSAWSFSEALRVGWSWLDATFHDKTFFPFPFDAAKQSQPVLSGSFGAVWNNPAGWRVASNAASGFRMPNVDDLGRVFDSAPGNLVVPNPDVKPEQTYNIDLNISKTIARRLRVEGVVWGTLFSNALVAAPFQLNGRDSIEFDGRLSRVTANQNIRKARLWGGMVSIESDITPAFAAFASVAFNKGRIVGQENQIPLDHIPPMYGKAGVRYHTEKLVGEVFTLFNGKKDIKEYNPTGEDNAQYAPAGGMPAWWTLHFRVGYKIFNFVTIQGGVDNLLDVQYRNFASGINGPGRNVFVTGRVRF